MTQPGAFIDGAFVDLPEGEVLEVLNPSTDAVIAELQLADPDTVDRAVAAARSALAD